MIFSSKALKLTSTSICESPVRRSIIVSHAGGLIPLCQIFHFRASSAIRKTILQRWLDAIWTPVGSKLYCDPHYRKEFMEPTNNAAFVYFLVRGGACPRDERKKKTTAHGSSGNNFCHNVCLVPLTPVLESERTTVFPGCSQMFLDVQALNCQIFPLERPAFTPPLGAGYHL